MLQGTLLKDLLIITQNEEKVNTAGEIDAFSLNKKVNSTLYGIKSYIHSSDCS